MDRLEEIRIWHQDVSMRFDDKPSRAHEDRGFLLAEIDRLQAEVERLRAGLDRLARLGNEPDYGNSLGNRLARQVLEAKP